MAAEPFRAAGTRAYGVVVVHVDIADVNDLQRLSKVLFTLVLPRFQLSKVERICDDWRIRAKSKDSEAKDFGSPRRYIQ